MSATFFNKIYHFDSLRFIVSLGIKPDLLYNQQIKLPLLEDKSIELFIKREDQIHPFISGNKFRKLKYNLSYAKSNGFKTLLTFGGAYSNHIAATAYAGYDQCFKTIGVIRGEELSSLPQNATLAFAQSHGMQFYFVDRGKYRAKDSKEFVEELKDEFGDFYLLPEGGTNDLAVQGVEEILEEEYGDFEFDYICTAVGTGGTISGLINSIHPNQYVLGFAALKGDFLPSEIRKFVTSDLWSLNNEYHFGGYGKINLQLIEFINQFKKDTSVALDPVYTGKMMYGILDLVNKDYFKSSSKILAIHTGGLQGIQGMNQVLKRKKLPLII